MKDNLSEEAISNIFEAVLTNNGIEPHGPLFAVGKEVPCQQGRPDLIASSVSFRTLPEKARTCLASALSHHTSAQIISLLKIKSPRTESNLRARSGMSLGVLRAKLRLLIDLKIISRNPSGTYEMSKHAPEFEPELWAFEVKLSNWKRALFQATQYTAFAHRVAIVIPEIFAHRINRHVEKFRRLGVGILAVEVDSGSIRVIAPSRKRRPASRSHYLFALGKLLKD